MSRSQRIEAYEDLMQQLEADGELEREVEFLPTTEEMLRAARGRRGHGAARARRAARLREALDRRRAPAGVGPARFAIPRARRPAAVLPAARSSSGSAT